MLRKVKVELKKLERMMLVWKLMKLKSLDKMMELNDIVKWQIVEVSRFSGIGELWIFVEVKVKRKRKNSCKRKRDCD